MKFSIQLVTISLCVMSRLQASQNYVHGQDNAFSCNSKWLHCDIGSQHSVAPYSISLSSYKIHVGQNITVLLSSTSNQRIMNFFMKAVAVNDHGDDGESLLKSVGKFAIGIQAPVNTLCCGTHTSHDSAISSQGNISGAIEVSATWMAPSYPGKFKFITAATPSFTTEWATIESDEVVIVDFTDDSDIGNSVLYQFQNLRDNCGSHQTCMAFPNECIYPRQGFNKTCDMFLSFYPFENEIIFEMMSRTNGYVAMGLSTDRAMGDDSVIECIVTETGVPRISASVNSPRDNMRFGTDPEYLRFRNSTFKDGVLYCSFSRPLTTTVGPITTNVKTTKYYILLATGETRRGVDIGYHINRVVSSKEIDLCSNDFTIIDSTDSPAPVVIIVHGAFMVVVWVGLVSLSIFLARFYKDMWPKKTLVGLKLWFAWHRGLNVAAVFLTIISIVLILLYTGITDIWNKYAHPSFGIVTAILAISQPFGAIFRPPPDAPTRQIFNWIHYGVGMMAFMFAIVTMFLAVPLKASHLGPTFYGVLGAFILYYVIIYGIVEIYVHIENQKTSLRMSGTSTSAGSLQMLDDSPFHDKVIRFKTLMLVMMIVGVLAFAIALVLIIAL